MPRFLPFFALAFIAVFGIAPVQAAPAVGKAAPDFTLPSPDGARHSLSDYKGKIVVLEWTNAECPFVRKHYESGNMQALQQKAVDDGVVWLSINSSAKGQQGYVTPEEAKGLSEKLKSHETARLLDGDGKVGRLYDAKTTPEIYIIDPQGVLVYHGAIDDRPSTDPATLEGATNYVSLALAQVAEGKKPDPAVTRSYGCGVKYSPQ